MGFKDAYTVRCMACRTKNRIPAEKMDAKAKCGKCSASIETDTLLSGMPVMVTEKNFDDKVLNSPLPVLLYCWAPWCATCKTTGPVIDAFAQDSKGRVRIAKLNAEANPGLTAKYSILSLPFILVFDNGQLKERFPGGPDKHEIMMKMASYI